MGVVADVMVDFRFLEVGLADFGRFDLEGEDWTRYSAHARRSSDMASKYVSSIGVSGTSTVPAMSVSSIVDSDMSNCRLVKELFLTTRFCSDTVVAEEQRFDVGGMVKRDLIMSGKPRPANLPCPRQRSSFGSGTEDASFDFKCL